MIHLAPILDHLGLRCFSADGECLIVFRGACVDHSVLLRLDDRFLFASCAVGRYPLSRRTGLAKKLLEWNGTRVMARAAVVDGRLVVQAELPAQGLAAASVETLLMSVANAAEELASLCIPLALRDCTPPRAGESGALHPDTRAAGTATPVASGNDRSLSGSSPDSDVDWDAEDGGQGQQPEADVGT